MTDKDNSQTGEYSYTYSYSYSKEGGEKNVEVHTGGFSAATAGEAAVDSTGKTTAGESSGGKSATGKTTTIKSTTGKTSTRSRSTTTSSRSSTSSRSKNDNSGPDVGYWIMTAIFFATGLWPVGLIMMISKLSDPKRRKAAAKTASTTTRKASAAIQKATQTPQYSAKSAKRMKIAGILLTIVGAVAFFNGVADNLFWLEDGFQLHYVKYFLEGLFYPTGLLAGGIGLLIGSGSMTRRHRRYASYLRIAGKRSSISVASLARAAEVSERRAERDLQAMLEKGLWGEEAYLDLGRGMLFRSHEAAEDQERQERQREAPQVPQEAEEGYSGMLRSIRRSNDRIADPELSRKIDRLEEIAGKILKLVEEDPAKKNQAATFLNYYLPTTEKLLDGLKTFLYDVVFCIYEEGEPEVEFVPLLDQELVAIVPPDHPLAAEDQILLSQLAPYPFITYMPHVQIYRDIMAYISQSGWTPQVFCNATGEASISSLVASGFGVSIVAKTDVLDNSQVKLLHLKDRLYKRTIYMAYRRDEEQPPSMQAFLRFVLQRARAQSDSQRHS